MDLDPYSDPDSFEMLDPDPYLDSDSVNPYPDSDSINPCLDPYLMNLDPQLCFSPETVCTAAHFV